MTHKDKIKLIEKVLSGKIDWGKELKIFDRLYKLYPDDSFWNYYIATIKFNINSLLFFYGKKPGELLKEQYDWFVSNKERIL